MNCPVCAVELRLAERQGVEIDYCPECRGVWLDRGELDKIIEKSSFERDFSNERQYRGPRPSYGDRSDHHPRPSHEDRSEHYHGKKKKSFLRDIFDFD